MGKEWRRRDNVSVLVGDAPFEMPGVLEHPRAEFECVVVCLSFLLPEYVSLSLSVFANNDMIVPQTEADIGLAIPSCTANNIDEALRVSYDGSGLGVTALRRWTRCIVPCIDIYLTAVGKFGGRFFKKLHRFGP